MSTLLTTVLGVVGVIFLFTLPFACYLTHISMTRGDIDRKAQEEGRGKLKFMPFRNLLARVRQLREEGRLCHDPHFKHFLVYWYTQEELTNKLLLEYQMHDAVLCNMFEDAHYKFCWHASILQVDGIHYWLSPIGFFLFWLYTSGSWLQELPEDYICEDAMRKAREIYALTKA